MKDNIDDGGPAFPHPTECAHGTEVPHLGMTLRDYFAAKAMAAIVGCYRMTSRGVENARVESEADLHSFSRDLALDHNHNTGEDEGASEISADAYAIADAMLAERKKVQS